MELCNVLLDTYRKPQLLLYDINRGLSKKYDDNQSYPLVNTRIDSVRQHGFIPISHKNVGENGVNSYNIVGNNAVLSRNGLLFIDETRDNFVVDWWKRVTKFVKKWILG